MENDEELLEKIREVVRKYHKALNERKHGGVASGNAINEIQELLNMPWERQQ